MDGAWLSLVQTHMQQKGQNAEARLLEVVTNLRIGSDLVDPP
jgi:hypothetical protein